MIAAAMLMGIVAPSAAARAVAGNRATTRSPIRLLAPQAGG